MLEIGKENVSNKNHQSGHIIGLHRNTITINFLFGETIKIESR